MNYVKQTMIIIAISCLGEALKAVLPLPIPASIYGMMILFVCLCTGIIKLESVRTVSRFLIEIMPIMFIPAGVGLMSSWPVLLPMLIPISIITVVTIITVMVVNGHISQFIIRKDRRAKNTNERII